MYTIDTTTGALTPKGEIGGSGTFGGIYGEGNTVVVDPSGRFAYVGQNELVNTTLSGGVSMNSIEATTGKLTSIETVDAAGDVLSLAVHPSGNFAYATVDAFPSPHVSVYTLNAATGVLASNGTAPTEQSPTSIAVDPSGKFAYVANYDSHSISMYTIDAVTGTLTLIGTIGT